MPPTTTLALVAVSAFRLPALRALPSSQALSSLLQITFFTLLSVLGVMLSLAGSILSCQNAQLVKSLEACERVRLDKAERPWHSESSPAAGLRGRGELVTGLSGGSWERARGLEVPHGIPRPQEKDSCICCQTRLGHAPASCSQQDEMLTMFPNPDCRSIRVALKVGEGSSESSCAPLQALQASVARPAPPQDLLFSVCGLTVFSTIICTLSAVVCCIQIFSLDIVHVVRPSPDPGGHGTRQRPQAGWATRGPGQDVAQGPCGDQEELDVCSCRISGQVGSAPCASSSLFPLPAAGPPALQLRDAGMHVAPRHLSAEHAGLRGVCASGATPPVLPTRVHVQLRDRRAEVPGREQGRCSWACAPWCRSRGGPFVTERSLSYLRWLFSSCLFSITYNGSMDSPVPLYPTDFPPSYETVMGLRGDSQVGAAGPWAERGSAPALPVP